MEGFRLQPEGGLQQVGHPVKASPVKVPPTIQGNRCHLKPPRLGDTMTVESIVDGATLDRLNCRSSRILPRFATITTGTKDMDGATTVLPRNILNFFWPRRRQIGVARRLTRSAAKESPAWQEP